MTENAWGVILDFGRNKINVEPRINIMCLIICNLWNSNNKDTNNLCNSIIECNVWTPNNCFISVGCRKSKLWAFGNVTSISLSIWNSTCISLLEVQAKSIGYFIFCEQSLSFAICVFCSFLLYRWKFHPNVAFLIIKLFIYIMKCCSFFEKWIYIRLDYIDYFDWILV